MNDFLRIYGVIIAVGSIQSPDLLLNVYPSGHIFPKIGLFPLYKLFPAIYPINFFLEPSTHDYVASSFFYPLGQTHFPLGSGVAPV